MKDCIDMGGTATLLTVSEKQGMGALTGAINGAAIGGPKGEMKDIGNGSFELSLYHWFLDRDGSTIYTEDKEILRLDSTPDVYLMEVAYTVVKSTGRFEGYRGTFHSRGWLKANISGSTVSGQAVGVVRFEGQLCRQ
jgi:hypothetical protein